MLRQYHGNTRRPSEVDSGRFNRPTERETRYAHINERHNIKVTVDFAKSNSTLGLYRAFIGKR